MGNKKKSNQTTVSDTSSPSIVTAKNVHQRDISHQHHQQHGASSGARPKSSTRKQKTHAQRKTAQYLEQMKQQEQRENEEADLLMQSTASHLYAGSVFDRSPSPSELAMPTALLAAMSVNTPPYSSAISYGTSSASNSANINANSNASIHANSNAPSTRDLEDQLKQLLNLT